LYRENDSSYYNKKVFCELAVLVLTSRSETVATVTGAHIYKCFQSVSEK